MTEHDEKWNMQFEQLVEFKRNCGHCMVPCKHEQDNKSLGKRGLTRSGNCMTTTLFDLIERNIWTKSDSLEKLMLTTPSNQTTSFGTSNMKSWSSSNGGVAIAWC
jgi:hypothetical protein